MVNDAALEVEAIMIMELELPELELDEAGTGLLKLSAAIVVLPGV